MIKKGLKKWLSLFVILTACMFITPIAASAEGIDVVSNDNASVRQIPYKPNRKCPKSSYHALFCENTKKSYSYYYFDSYGYDEFQVSVLSISGPLTVEILDYYTDEVLYSKTFYEGNASSIWGPSNNRTFYIRFTSSSGMNFEYNLNLL